MNIIEALRSGKPVKALIDLRELRFESFWDLSVYISKYDATFVQKILECETWEIQETYYLVTEEELTDLLKYSAGAVGLDYLTEVDDRIKARGPANVK